MKLRRLLAILLAFSTLCFIPSCGDDNGSAPEAATETTQEYTHKSFGDIGFDIKSTWNCEERLHYLKVTDPDDGSYFEVHLRNMDHTRKASDELYDIYGDLWASTDYTNKSSRQMLKDCDIYTCTYKIKETNCNMVLYWFEYKDNIYTIYFQKDGKINEYADAIMNETLVLMKLQKNIGNQ